MKNTSRHIVFLSPGFSPTEETSTVIPALQEFLKSIRNALPHCKMTLLSFQYPHTKSAYTWHGIDVIPLNGQSLRYKKLLVWKRALQQLSKIHKEHPISNIHSFWIGECSLIGEHFSKKHKINHMVTVMGQDAKTKNRYTKQLINSRAKIITLSPNHSTTLSKNCQLTSHIIPWFVDIDCFPKLQASTIDIIGVGSLNQVKNYPNFIDIIAVLVKTNPNLTVEIIGEGDQTQLAKLIKGKMLENTITLIGGLSRNHVLKKMAKAKLLLHTSMYESFGLVFSEALYSGMYIASYNVGIAKPLEQWKICENTLALIRACKEVISSPMPPKKRILLHAEQKAINAYIELYNSSFESENNKRTER